jgi:hypothetical protein
MKYLYALLAFALPASAFSATPIRVPIHFFEALAPKDTTSSERFQTEYDSAVRTAKTLASARLSKCGYAIDDKTVFYSASDALEAHERGAASEKSHAWMIVGPRRSNHYALLAKGAPNTPSVSTMASSQEIEGLAPLHVSIAPTNRKMAAVAALESKQLAKLAAPTYVSIVSEDCLSCVDFATNFDEAALPLKFKKLSDFRIQGETPDLKVIAASVASTKPAIVLVPNYSKVAAQIIAAIHSVYPTAIYVGGDGWGDSRFGFVQDAKDLQGTKGITVRGFPSTEAGLAAFPLGKSLLASKDPSTTKPGSATALSILKIVEGAADLLCKYKPKSESDFKAAFLKGAPKSFKSPWGVSIYQLKDGDIRYQRIVKGSNK